MVDHVCGYGWDSVSGRGIVTVQRAEGTSAYRINNRSDCNIEILQTKHDADDPMFSVELTQADLGSA